MKNQFKMRLISLMMAIVMAMGLVLTVSASTGTTVDTTPVSLKINGLTATTTDETGKQNQSFTSDGTVYVPVSDLAGTLGESVTKNADSNTVEIGTKGNDAANDAAYLKEYFAIPNMGGTVDWKTYTAVLKKLGVKNVTTSGTLTAASAAKSVVALANMTELAGTYTADEAKTAVARYGAISAADAPYVACAVQMNLIPGIVDFTAPLTGDVASVILMNAVEASGKGRNFIGFSSDPDIAARLVSTWNSFTLFDDPTLTNLGVAIVKSGATTGYNLKYDGNAARFLSGNTIQYGHSDITHAVQLMGLLNRAGLIARVQLEPKVSAYQYLLEWSDGKLPPSTPTYQVKQVSDDLYVCFAVEYDLQLEFSSKADRSAFDKLIATYAKKSDANPDGNGMIYGAWWQPLYSTKDAMPSPEYQQINDVVVRDGAYTIHPFATNEKLDAVKTEVTKDAPGLTCSPVKLWVNAAFYRYITGTDHQ